MTNSTAINRSEQWSYSGKAWETLAILRDVAITHIERRLQEHLPPDGYSAQSWEHKNWLKKCRTLATIEAKASGDVRAVSVSKKYNHPESDPVSAIYALETRTLNGPLFGPRITQHTAQLIAHRNSIAHLNDKFTRCSTHQFMTIVIEICQALGEHEASSHVHQLRTDLGLDQNLSLIETQPAQGELASPGSNQLDGAVQHQTEQQPVTPEAQEPKVTKQQKAELYFNESGKKINASKTPDEAVCSSIEAAKHLIQLDAPELAYRSLQRVQFKVGQAGKDQRSAYYEQVGITFREQGKFKPALKNFKKAETFAQAGSKLANRLTNRINECKKKAKS